MMSYRVQYDSCSWETEGPEGSSDPGLEVADNSYWDRTGVEETLTTYLIVLRSENSQFCERNLKKVSF